LFGAWELLTGPSGVLETLVMALSSSFIITSRKHVNSLNLRVGKAATWKGFKITLKKVVIIVGIIPGLLLGFWS
jgi:hypothetical protein